MSRSRATAAVAVALALTAATASAATPKEDVTAAVQKLADAKGYTYTATVENAGGGGGGPGGGGSTGKVERDGYTSVEMQMRDNTVKLVRKGNRTVLNMDEDGWKTPEEMADAQGPARYVGNLARNYRPPAEQAKQVLADAAEVKRAADGSYTAELPAEAAKKLMTRGFRGRRGGNAAGGNGPDVSDAKASATFTLGKDGSLAKMAVHVSGTVSFNGQDRDVDRTTTVEFKDVGTTTADVPAEAKAKLESTQSESTQSPATKP